MSRWFRFYAEALRNPKVMKLTDIEFRLWVRLLAIASENDGKIPPVDDLKLLLNSRLDRLLRGLNGLISGGLIDALEVGYEPHHWNKYQYKSDTSTDRVTKHRAKRNVSVTPPDTDTETDTEKEEEGNAPKGAQHLAFEGRVIRLTEIDLGRWKRAYPKIDLLAVLQSRDDWLATEADTETRKRWFISTSNYLSGLQGKATAARQEIDRRGERLTV